jgi:hypothetical protein
MRRIARGAIALAALAALCALALPRGFADLRAFEARVAVRSWEAKRRPPTTEEWNGAHELLAEARQLDAGHPAFLEDMARLHELRALPLKPDDAHAREELRLALGFQRQAASLRPSSPYTWANIALLKARLSETDQEFEGALRNAALLGPWEPGVQLALVDAGFRYWGALSPETRSALVANAGRTLRREDAKLFELARRNGRLDVVCALRGVERSRFANTCI